MEEICEYITRDSEYYGRLFAQRIVSLIESIPEFPEAGRIVPEYGKKEVRERFFQNYRIVYGLKPDAIEIVSITHGTRLLTSPD